MHTSHVVRASIFAAILIEKCFYKYAHKNYDVDVLSIEIMRNLAITFLATIAKVIVNFIQNALYILAYPKRFIK